MANNYSSPSFNDKMLFWASFFTLIAAGMGFSIRGDIIAAWGKDFGFTQTDLGKILGFSLAGFGVTIIFFSFFTDLFGYGRLMIIAFLLHTVALVATIMAPWAFSQYGKEGAYWALLIGQFSFSLANGTCEAVINPLTATLFPKNKTHWLNILHAGWPGGLVLGALVGLGLDKMGDVGWQIRWAIYFAPVLLFGLMMVARPFPKSEAKASGVALPEMMGVVGFLGMAVASALIGLWLSSELLPAFGISGMYGWIGAAVLLLGFGAATGFKPGHIILAFLYILHALVGYVELGTDSWIQNITVTVLQDRNVMFMSFIWTNLLMFTLRFFAGPIVHKISPLGLLFASAVLGAVGLFLLSRPEVDSTWLWMGAITIYSLGKTFYWPTMLGVISERYPKGGALALGISGGVGMLCAGTLGGTMIGYKQDYAATTFIQQSAPATYERYTSGEPKAPLGIDLLPKIAGLDNAKIGVLNDDAKTIKTDLERSGGKDKNAAGLNEWWESKAKAFATTDKPKIEEASIHGGRTALFWTAAVPATLAIGYLLLILVFRAQGGYRQVHIDGSGGH